MYLPQKPALSIFGFMPTYLNSLPNTIIHRFVDFVKTRLKQEKCRKNFLYYQKFAGGTSIS
jgi:hypothetical protein